MAEFEYNPLAEYITLKWRCPNCGTENESDAFSVQHLITSQKLIMIALNLNGMKTVAQIVIMASI